MKRRLAKFAAATLVTAFGAATVAPALAQTIQPLPPGYEPAPPYYYYDDTFPQPAQRYYYHYPDGSTYGPNPQQDCYVNNLNGRICVD